MQHIKKNVKENNWQLYGRAWVRNYRFCNWSPTQFTPAPQTKDRRERFKDGNKFDIAHCSDRECNRRVRQAEARRAA